jgi:hypothetical protein
MKGFKGFDENLKCLNKQYTIGGTFKEDKADLCNEGLHFCEYPLDCIRYYLPPESRFAEIEANEVSEVDDEKNFDSKRVAKKITVKSELSLKELIEAAVKFTFDKATRTDKNKATGDYGTAAVTGDYGTAAAIGDWGTAAATGHRGTAAVTGDWGTAAVTGHRGTAAVTGDYGTASVKGKNSVVAAVGIEGSVAGALGCWIILAEWSRDKKNNWYIKQVKSAKVDGKKIRPDTFYILKNGKFMEKQNGEVPA